MVLCPTICAVSVDGSSCVVAVLLAVDVDVDARLLLCDAGVRCCSTGCAVDLVSDGVVATGVPGVAAEGDDAVCC
jgi:hypothetical protein